MINLNYMKKVLILCAVAFAMFSTAKAQESRNKVHDLFLNDIVYAHQQDKEEKLSTGEVVEKVLDALATGGNMVQETKHYDDVKNAVIMGLSKAKRFNLNDRDVTPADTLDPENRLVDIFVANVISESKLETYGKGKDKKTYYHYKARVEVMLTFKDVVTGQVKLTHNFSESSSGSSSYYTKEKVISNAIGYLVNDIAKFMNKLTPFEATILEGGKFKKDKQQEVYIDFGTAEGAEKGMQFDVFSVRLIAGREAKTKVGKIKIIEVQGEEISLCKVTSGEKEIKAALDANQELVLVSKE